MYDLSLSLYIYIYIYLRIYLFIYLYIYIYIHILQTHVAKAPPRPPLGAREDRRAEHRR